MGLSGQEYNYVQGFADFLSLITISSCFILKVPQILNLIKVKSAVGMNLMGLLLELTSYTITFSYNFRSGYAVLSYLEYPIILVQEIVLIYFVLYYKNLLDTRSFIGASIYFSITYLFLTGYMPREFLMFCIPLCTPIGASSKVMHLYEIFRAKNSNSVSVLTWFISAFTNMTRIFTIYVDSADPALLLNFTVNLILSSSIMIAARYYKTKMD